MSAFCKELVMYKPKPGQANTVSVSTEPSSKPAYDKAITVTRGTMALRKAWPQMMRVSESPLARAATMYSCASSLSMKERVMREI